MSRWILSVALLLSAGPIRAQDARFESAVACIKRYEGMHDHRHLPYVGYGHNYPNLDIILTLYCK